jgi:O-antigen/teichoic acid export membrane protein
MGSDTEGEAGWGHVPSLGRSTLRGARLSLVGFVVSRGLMLAAYVVLARLVSPTDFGHYAAASVITGVGTVFSESGMLSALIRRPDRIDEAASTAFFSLIVSGTLLTLGALAVAPLVGWFFHSGSVTALSAALAAALLVQSLSVVPDAVLQRRFSFARRVAVDPLASVAFCAVAILAAVGGAGAWALVAGAYASLVVSVIAAFAFARFRPRLKLASVAMWRELASFARPVLGSEILSRVATQLDTVMLGRFKGAAALGQYRNGLRVAQQPSDGFVSIGAYVLLPALVRLHEHPERLRAATRRVYRQIAAVALPLSVMFLPLGVPAAVLLLGPRWRPAGHAIVGLCGLLIASATMSASSEVYKAVGRPRLLIRMHTVSLTTIAIFVVAAAIPFGLVGVAVAVSASRCVTAVYGLRQAGRVTGLHRDDLTRALKGPVAASLVMVLAMFGFAALVSPLDHRVVLAWALTVAEAVLGAIVYGIVLLGLDRDRRRSAMNLVAVAHASVLSIVLR